MSSEKTVPVLQHWIIDKEKEWETIKKQGDKSEVYAFFSSIVDYASSLDDQKNVEECLTLLETCHKQIDESENPFLGLYGLTSLGMDAYNNGVFSVAEMAFRVLSDSGDSNGRNNYAYMMRRSEVSDPMVNSPLKALRLLRDGIKESEPFAFVNAALTFTLCFGSDEDWHLADELMKRLPETNTLSIRSWWEEVGHNGEIEGFLVHFFLLRHEKIEHSTLGSVKSIALRLKKKLDGFPDWLADEYTIETLDDVIGCIDDPDFDTILEDFLDKMPYSRESVDEMLEVVSGWDLWAVYDKLLTECESFLTTDEIIKLKADYKEKFDLPLPGETE